MKKRLLSVFLCAFLAFSFAACNSASENNTENNAENSTEEEETPKPILGADATDEELLDVVKDDINVVTDDNYIETVTNIQEDVTQYTGKLYQIEGTYKLENDNPYINRVVVDGDKKTDTGLPLQYLNKELEEGAWVKITGVVNVGEIDGKNIAVLDVVVVETPEEEGQAELQAK